MGSREELKVLIDQLPEARLEAVRTMLEHQVHPRPPRPELDRIQRRGEEYRRLVEQRFRETGRPGTVGGVGGAGFGAVHDGVPFGSHGFHYWDGDALVNQTLQSFSGQEIEIMQRLSMSSDRTKLNCIVELSSGSHTVRHEDEFPVSETQAISTDH
jgi:hypothetical protein